MKKKVRWNWIQWFKWASTKYNEPDVIRGIEWVKPTLKFAWMCFKEYGPSFLWANFYDGPHITSRDACRMTPSERCWSTPEEGRWRLCKHNLNGYCHLHGEPLMEMCRGEACEVKQFFALKFSD